jgi:hypothetical protein
MHLVRVLLEQEPDIRRRRMARRDRQQHLARFLRPKTLINTLHPSWPPPLLRKTQNDEAPEGVAYRGLDDRSEGLPQAAFRFIANG